MPGARARTAAPSSSAADVSTARPTCDNHDDGDTLAIIRCDECGNLCSDCDRFLHLSRKMRAHTRQVRANRSVVFYTW